MQSVDIERLRMAGFGEWLDWEQVCDTIPKSHQEILSHVDHTFPRGLSIGTKTFWRVKDIRQWTLKTFGDCYEDQRFNY